MTKKQVIEEIQTILHETQLPPRYGRYVYGERAHWYFSKGRERLKNIVESLKKQ